MAAFPSHGCVRKAAVFLLAAAGLAAAILAIVELNRLEPAEVVSQLHYEMPFSSSALRCPLYRAGGVKNIGSGRLTALAAAADGRWAAARGATVVLFDGATDAFVEAWDASTNVSAMALWPDGSVVLGVGDHLEFGAPHEALTRRGASLGTNAIVTGIAIWDHTLAVADAGQRIVWLCDAEGRPVGKLGARDPARNIPGFIVPSACFTVAAAPDGLLRVVNPGRRRIEAYTRQGDLETFWGHSGMAADAFCGCCNPVYLAIRPDGIVITSEKGLRRVKAYDASGRYLGLMADASVLGGNEGPAAPIAVDGAGRLRVGLPDGGVQLFEPVATAAVENRSRAREGVDSAAPEGRRRGGP